MVWIKEYGEQEFYLTSDMFDAADLGEGDKIEATIVVESGKKAGVTENILWLQHVVRQNI